MSYIFVQFDAMPEQSHSHAFLPVDAKSGVAAE